MDLDRSLDDLIKQKKNKPKRNLPERKQKQNKNLSIHTKAKIKKTTTLNTGKSNIISRLVSETIYFVYFILD